MTDYRYQIECLDPYAPQPFGVMNDGFANDYPEAERKLRDYADYFQNRFPVIFRLWDTQENRVLDFIIVRASEQLRYRIGEPS